MAGQPFPSRAADGALRGFDAVAARCCRNSSTKQCRSTVPFLRQERCSSIGRDLSVASAARDVVVPRTGGDLASGSGRRAASAAV